MKNKSHQTNRTHRPHNGDRSADVLFGYRTDRHRPSVGFKIEKPLRISKYRPLKLKLDGHVCVIASTGAGKSRNCVIPAMLDPENRTVVCIDVKGELTQVTRRFREQLGPVYIIDAFNVVLKDSKDSACLNPLDAFRFDSSEIFDKAMTMVEVIRGGIPLGLKDPFWERSSGYTLAALISNIAELEDPSKRNLNQLFSRYLGSADFDYTVATELDSGKVKPLAYTALASYLSLPERETRPSVKATCMSNVAPLASEAVEKTIGRTTIDLDAFRRGDPMTIYIVIPPSKLISHAGFLRLMLGTLMNIIASRTAIPEHKTCFYVDEAAQLGFMPQLLEALTLMRSYGLQCTTYWQDLSQIQYHYPTGWQAIVNNSAVLQIFGIKNHWVARSLADIVGVEARQLLQMLPDEQLLVHEGKNIHTARRLDYLKDPMFKGRWDPNPMFNPPPPPPVMPASGGNVKPTAKVTPKTDDPPPQGPSKPPASGGKTG